MADTLGDMKTRIASDIERELTDETFTARTWEDEIEASIFDAITLQKSKQYWFMQQPTSAAITSSCSTTSSYVSEPTGLVQIDSLRLTVNGEKQPVDPCSFEEMESLHDGNTTDTGEPFKYCRYGQRVRLYPAPNDTYTLTWSGLFDDAAMDNDADQTVWTTVGKGELLIRRQAKVILYRDYIKAYNDVPAAVAALKEAENALDREHAKRVGTRRLKARC